MRPLRDSVSKGLRKQCAGFPKDAGARNLRDIKTQGLLHLRPGCLRVKGWVGLHADVLDPLVLAKALAKVVDGSNLVPRMLQRHWRLSISRS